MCYYTQIKLSIDIFPAKTTCELNYRRLNIPNSMALFSSKHHSNNKKTTADQSIILKLIHSSTYAMRIFTHFSTLHKHGNLSIYMRYLAEWTDESTNWAVLYYPPRSLAVVHLDIQKQNFRRDSTRPNTRPARPPPAC